uniref:Putative secreted protein n=1 Tax=Anopheles darlingi TaxID=43151 RepID=A0A2M4DMM6_ANODA
MFHLYVSSPSLSFSVFLILFPWLSLARIATSASPSIQGDITIRIDAEFATDQRFDQGKFHLIPQLCETHSQIVSHKQ